MSHPRWLIVLCVVLFSGGAAAADPAPCDTYPIIIPEEMVQAAPAGVELTLSEHNWGPGASGWLTWDGDPGAGALAASLVPPGNVATYVNPGDAADHRLDTGDWVASSPGHKWTRAVRDNLGLLLDRDLVVPTFVDERLQGGQLQYRVARFVTIRIVGLTVQQSIRFEYRGPSACGTAGILAADQSLRTSEETPLAIRLGAASAGDLPLAYVIADGPAHGTLTGQPPDLTYTPDLQYQGGDHFTFFATAGGVESNVATATIDVTPVNDAPLITSAPVIEVEDGAPYAYLAAAEDLDGDVLAWSLVDAPPGMSIDVAGGEVSWLVVLRRPLGDVTVYVRNPLFQNVINSISPRHSWYGDAVAWGEAWLRANGL